MAADPDVPRTSDRGECPQNSSPKDGQPGVFRGYEPRFHQPNRMMLSENQRVGVLPMTTSGLAVGGGPLQSPFQRASITSSTRKEIGMSENSDGGIGPLSFIVGGLVVATGVAVFLYSGGYIGGYASSTTTERTTVLAPGATAPATATTTEKK